jgi:hypothetical protein
MSPSKGELNAKFASLVIDEDERDESEAKIREAYITQ